MENGSTWGDLLTAFLVKLDESPVKISTGFPPHPITPLGMEQNLTELGIKSGDTLSVTTNSTAIKNTVETATKPCILIREMPDDNSCLFNAIGYVFHNSRSLASSLRQMAASLILSDPSYNESILGMSPEKYATWIQENNHWGGGIELAVFAGYYGVEIASIDVGSGRVDIFGEGKGYEKRVYILYSGIHYDALALAEPGSPEGGDQTIFGISDDDILVQVMQVAELAKMQHRYTDLAKFTLRCEVCKEALTGEREAERHATDTGHTSFIEYSDLL